MRAYLKLHSSLYKGLLNEFRLWYIACGYSLETAKSNGNHLREFFCFLEQDSCFLLNNLNENLFINYKKYLEERLKFNASTGSAQVHEGLKQNTIHAKIRVLHKFSGFLYKVKNISLSVPISSERIETNERQILNQKEMKRLYGFCEFKQRDRAILAIYYGCALRVSEGAALTIDDINFEKKCLYVRKGKGGKERLVPMSKQVMEDLEDYIFDERVKLLKGNHFNQLLIGKRLGQPLQAAMISKRFRQLLAECALKQGRGERLSLHCLRHSIASHLLENGMKLEDVSSFLGHSSLASTQIYTHLLPQAAYHKEVSQIHGKL